MANSHKACKHCKEFVRVTEGVQQPKGFFCTIDHAIEWGKAKAQKDYEKQKAKADKEYRKETKQLKEKIRKRTGEGGYYEALRTALHRYVKHVLRKGEPCYTCGKRQSFSDSGGAFHVGHFIPAKEVDPRRFMLENLRIQCYSCNAMNGGRRAEYRINLVNEMGLEHVEWLEADCNHLDLKQKYPNIEDIKKETAHYVAITKKAFKEAQ